MGANVTDDRRRFDALLRELGRLAKSTITIGVHEDAKPQLDDEGKAVMAMPMLAAIHEFGTDKIPERSFLRSTFAAKNAGWEKQIANQIGRIVGGSQTVGGALKFMGVVAAADVRATIGAGIRPSLAPATIAGRERKGRHGGGAASHAGSFTPLIDSGQLLNSIGFEVDQ